MSRYFPTPDECGHHTVFGKVPIRTYAGDHLQISVVTIPADGLVDWHSHGNEQMGIVIAGRAVFHIGDEVKELGEGDIFLIPGGVRHKVEPLGGPVRAVDFFYPIRDEYR
jgi:quercetin dioxygenase-like cupin family protein